MSLLVLSVLAGVAIARPDTTVPVLPGLGSHHRVVTTGVSGAQQSFDQGLRLLFGFNHSEAELAFRSAVARDSTMAMAYWGLAQVASPYLDRGRQPSQDAIARGNTIRARRLASRATSVERDLIEALFIRFGDSTQAPATADSAYSRRLASLHRKYPRDADIAALFGESVMLLSRRSYWNGPELKPGMSSAQTALEAALRIDSMHPFANHLYVHFFEAAHDPRPAIPAAERLRTIAPGAGHLLHMSSHIFARVGRYEEAAEANRRAWQADRVYFDLARPGPTSTYRSGYHLHTLHFLWSVLAMQRKQGEALAVAESLAARVNPAGLPRSIYQQSWAAAPLLVSLRFENWERIRSIPPPADSQLYSSLLWHHARGTAAAARGEIETAEQHLARLQSRMADLPPNATVAPTARAAPLARIALLMTMARVTEARGNADSSLALLRLATAVQDSLGHMEPPPWYIPLRQALGAALLRASRPDEAERVFLEDLALNPRNPWSESGLAQARLMQDPEQERRAVLAVTERMVQAMKTRDTATLRALFHPNARLVGMRTRPGDSVPFIQELTIDQFAGFVARDSLRGTWIERLWNPRVEVEGSLATVWAQYDFHFGQRFSHCGADAFHLLKTRDGWLITALADTYQSEGCPIHPVPAASSASTSGLRVERLADGVYAVIRQEPMGLINESNSMFIVGEEDVIVVDAQSSVSRTLETLAALRRITPNPVRAVINTHWHDDHVFGNGVYRDSFPAVQFIAHAASAEDLAATGLASRAEFDANREGTRGFLTDLVAKGQSFAGGPLSDEERASHVAASELVVDYGRTPPGYIPQAPTTLVSDSLVLRQSRRMIRVLYLGRGHSRGDLVVHLPAEGIIAAGDLVMAPVQFVGTTSFPSDFAVSVDKLIALQPGKIVPGHGPVLAGTDHARLISRMLHSLTDQVRTARARGETLEQVKSGVTLDEFSRAFAGDSQILKILFSYYVSTPAIQRAYELN